MAFSPNQLSSQRALSITERLHCLTDTISVKSRLSFSPILTRTSKWSHHEILPFQKHQLTNDVVGALQNLFGNGHVDRNDEIMIQMHHI